MPDSKYHLVFRGQISPGSQIVEVKSNVARLLKLDDAKADLLFGGRTTILKRNLSWSDAERFRAMFDATGAVSVVEPAEVSAPQPVPPQPSVSDPTAIGRMTPAQGNIDPDMKPPGRPQAEKIACPKCGANQEKSETCLSCGVIFAKLHKEEAERPPVASVAPETATPPLAGNAKPAVPGTRQYGIGSWLGLLVGCVCLIFAVYNLITTAIFVKSSREATGKIIGFAADRSGSGRSSSTVYAPEVDFREPGGRKIRFRSKVYSNIGSYKTGDPVPVRFEPGNPHHAEIDGFIPLWGLASFLLVFGAIFAWAGGNGIRIQNKVRNAVPRKFTPEELAGDWIYCPKCGSHQPDANVCAYCRVAITSRQKERLNRWFEFVGKLSAAQKGEKAGGNAALAGKALRIVPPIIAVGVFAWNAFSMFHQVKNTPNVSVPFDGRDDYHKVAITVPTDWQLQSTKKEAITPLLRSQPDDRFYVIAKSKRAENAFWAMGVSGIGLDHFRSAGWEGIVAETGRTSTVKFADTAEFNGLTVYRVGYDLPEGYREDAYFEAAKDLMEVSFVLPRGSDGAERVAELRNFVMTNLTGI